MVRETRSARAEQGSKGEEASCGKLPEEWFPQTRLRTAQGARTTFFPLPDKKCLSSYVHSIRSSNASLTNGPFSPRLQLPSLLNSKSHLLFFRLNPPLKNQLVKTEVFQPSEISFTGRLPPLRFRFRHRGTRRWV